MENLGIPQFDTKKELFEFLVENKSKLIAQKKAMQKHGDITFVPSRAVFFDANKAESNSSKSEINVKVVINTTNLMDSHLDVHIPGLWDKSLAENKMIMFLQEHKMSFDKIIADGEELKAYTSKMLWKDLGYEFEGQTEALVFDATIKADRNPFMLNQYAKGYVKQHSVGMRYVQLVMAVNDEKYGAEFEAWEKYFPMIANKDDAEEMGYFWAVKEAKVLEGSAVPLGSNIATPTLEAKQQPPKGTEQPPEPSTVDIKEAIKTVKFF